MRQMLTEYTVCPSRYINGAWEPYQAKLPEECLLRVSINNRSSFNLTCSPSHLRELITGHLLTSGWISGINDIASLEINDYCASVSLRNPSEIRGNCANPVSNLDWNPAWIDSLSEVLQAGLPLYNETHSTHSCLLMQRGILQCAMEDIGRHNAMDKAIGYALLNNIDLNSCIAFSSGRLPVDMVKKSLSAGIPVLAAKGLPTVSAIQLAVSHQMVLLHAPKDGALVRFA